MRSAVERCETFLALEAFQDQYTDVWIFDLVANFVWDFSVIGRIAHFEQFIGPSQVIYVFEYLLWGLTAAYF